jgi:acyl-coenzyme A thioesterase PaaI-like protein
MSGQFADPRVLLAQLPFVRSYGIVVVSVTPGEVVVEMPFDARFSTPPAAYPASIVGTVGDVAAVSSCISRLPRGWAAATLDFTIKMTARAQGEKLIARGRVLQAGQTTSVGTADVFAVAAGHETHCGVVLATTRNFEVPARG